MSETLARKSGIPHTVVSPGSHKSPASTGSLAVNAAFLKEIKDDNRQLKGLWDKLVPMFSHHQTAKNHWTELVAGLSELRDQLAIHFSLEEAYGYFAEAVDIAPHLSLVAESLRSDRSKLFAEIRDLADRIAACKVARVEHIEKVIFQFNQFRKQCQRLEEAE